MNTMPARLKAIGNKQRWTQRALTKADGEYILWHIVEHLEGEPYVSPRHNRGVDDAILACRVLLTEFREEL